MKLQSSAFEHEGSIPRKFTCQGENTNPELLFLEVPKEAASLVLLMDDPDVPASVRPECMYDHWVLYNIDPSTTKIAADSTTGTQGLNTSGSVGYRGPCPPDREHRYFFKLYALDCKLDLKEGASKDEVLEKIDDHILAEAVLMGRYEQT